MNTLNTIFLLISTSLLSFSFEADHTSASIDSLIQNIATDDAILIYSSIQELKTYDYSSFSDAHRVALNAQLLEDTPHLNKLVELCGFLLMKEELRAFAQNKALPNRVQEKLNYALVRAGDKDKLRTMLKNLTKHKLSDDFAYNLCPILAYTCQKEVFDHLLERIQEEGKPCNHPDMDTPGKFTCAYPIISSIAPYIVDFPAEVGKYGIETDDPAQLLEDVRSWIKSNKATYQLNTNRY